jgi:hypothetical protein
MNLDKTIEVLASQLQLARATQDALAILKDLAATGCSRDFKGSRLCGCYGCRAREWLRLHQFDVEQQATTTEQNWPNPPACEAWCDSEWVAHPVHCSLPAGHPGDHVWMTGQRP